MIAGATVLNRPAADLTTDIPAEHIASIACLAAYRGDRGQDFTALWHRINQRPRARAVPHTAPTQQPTGVAGVKHLWTEDRILEYPVRKQGPYTIIALSGELDLSCSPDARQQILACIEGGGTVLVEMAAVDYIDSSGIASLVEGLQSARRKKQKFALVSVSKSAMQVLRIARLDSVFEIYGCVAEAYGGQGINNA